MRPARFAYARPETLDEAVSEQQRLGPGARVLAGGQSLLPEMYRRLRRPTALVDLGRIPALGDIRHDGQSLRLGATTTHHTVETASVAAGYRVLPEAARLIGHLPVRVRGTVGGSLAHADPAAEWCLLAALFDAEINAVGPDGVRTLSVPEFFTGRGETGLRWDEIITEVRLPAPAPSAVLIEFGEQDGSMPLVAAAAAVELGPDGTVDAARLALGGVAAVPLRLPQAEHALMGTRPSPTLFRQIAADAAARLDPPGDVRAPAAYRRELAATMLRRALRASVGRASAPAARTTDQQKAENR